MPRIRAMPAARRSALFALAVGALLMPGSGIGQDKVRFPISVASKTVGFVPVWAAWRMGFSATVPEKYIDQGFLAEALKGIVGR